MTEVNAILIADSVDFASDVETPNPLKIKGNVVSTNPTDTWLKRNNPIDKSRPSVFIVFDASMYMDLLPYLSINKYDWQELQ